MPMSGRRARDVNGRLTLGENIADLGGLVIALEALRAAIEEGTTDDRNGRRVHARTALLPGLRRRLARQHFRGVRCGSWSSRTRTRHPDSASTGRSPTCQRSRQPSASWRARLRWPALRRTASRSGDWRRPLKRGLRRVPGEGIVLRTLGGSSPSGGARPAQLPRRWPSHPAGAVHRRRWSDPAHRWSLYPVNASSSNGAPTGRAWTLTSWSARNRATRHRSRA